MPIERGTGCFLPASPAGQRGEITAKSLFPPPQGHKMPVRHGLTTKASCVCTVEFCICHRAWASVASRPATVPFLCREQWDEDSPLGMQVAPAACPATHLHFLQPLQAPCKAREAGLHYRDFHLEEDRVIVCPKTSPGKCPPVGLAATCPPMGGPSPCQHPLTSSWKRP